MLQAAHFLWPPFLLGGLYRRRIRLYPHLKGTWNSFPDPTQDDLFSEPWGEIEYTPEQLGKHAQQLVAEGYTAMKFDPFRPGRDGYHGYRPDEIAAVVDRVAAIREAVGPSVDLMVECHGKFNAGTAIKIGKKLEQFDLFWYEEPVPVGMISMMKRVADAVNIPLAACERLNSKLDLKEYLEKAAVDVVMFDVGKIGGITEAMNREKAFYSQKRLMSAVERGKSASVEALTQELLRSVKEFTEGEAISDDITLLALQFNG